MAGIIVLLSAVTTVNSADMQNEPEKKAVAHFPVSHYRFDAVIEGTDVVYDFIVQNKGDAPLDIIKVRTG